MSPQVTIDEGSVRWSDGDHTGRIETWGPNALRVRIARGETHETIGAALFGLGQQQHGRLDHQGHVIDLEHHNGHVTIPFLLASRGYGFLWNNPSIGRVELALPSDRTRWVA